MANPIKRIYTNIMPNNTTRIYWELNAGTKLVNATFQVFSAKDINGNWVAVNEPINQDSLMINYVTDLIPWASKIKTIITSYSTDVGNKVYNVEPDTFYKLVLNNNGIPYESQPIHCLNGLNWRKFLVYSEILRKEQLYTTYLGTPVYVKRRKWWGTLCSCVDPDTESPINEFCTICYGTRFVGGYYQSLDAVVTFTPQTRQMTTQLGTDEVIIKVARMPATTYMSTGDILIDKIDNNRYFVKSVKDTALFDNLPTVYELQLGLIRPTDITYSVGI